ncbi:MAG: hypothetical protein IPK58_01420 [Acidobacteria bacterium]|nr:hypothetical protein [Acidobacteriota bacterium]
METIKTVGAPKLPPALRMSSGRKSKPRQPSITITDDGDIPSAVKPILKDQ